jgi:hypothetical protein
VVPVFAFGETPSIAVAGTTMQPNSPRSIEIEHGDLIAIRAQRTIGGNLNCRRSLHSRNATIRVKHTRI